MLISVLLLLPVTACTAEDLLMNVQRCPLNPIITPASGAIGDNINGPSVIRVPAWVQTPLGRYYLYFAHHQGDSIRLAYADMPEGPWRVHDGRPLRLTDVQPLGYTGHIASPDLLIDNDHQRILMFFHGPNADWKLADTPGLRTHFSQATGLAQSKDGLHFTPVSGPVLGSPYFRVFMHGGRAYALSARGLLFRCPTPGVPDGSTSWVERREPLGRWRHCTTQVTSDQLVVAYTTTGDQPERILCAMASLAGPWESWRLDDPHEVLRPELPWEGAGLPLIPSRTGSVKGRENALRDPFLFRDADSTWLYYSIAGESGIAVARFTMPQPAEGSP